MKDLLDGKRIIVEVSEDDVGWIVIVNQEDYHRALSVVNRVLDDWRDDDELSEEYDLQSDAIDDALESVGIEFLMPSFEEVWG